MREGHHLKSIQKKVMREQRHEVKKAERELENKLNEKANAQIKEMQSKSADTVVYDEHQSSDQRIPRVTPQRPRH